MAVEIDDFLTDVLSQAGNVPELVAYKHLRDAARELCERTKLWREWDSFTVSAPSCEGVSTIADADIVVIEAAQLDGYQLDPVTPAWLDEEIPDWATMEVNVSSARYVTQLRPDTVQVVPAATGLLRIRLVLKPSRTAMTFPDFLLDHATALGRVAAGRALLNPDADYANPQLGSSLISEFGGVLDTLSVRAAKGQHRAPLRSKARFF